MATHAAPTYPCRADSPIGLHQSAPSQSWQDEGIMVVGSPESPNIGKWDVYI